MKKRLLCLVLVIVMLLGMSIPVSAATLVDTGSCGDNATYKLYSDGLLKITGTGPLNNGAFYALPDVVNVTVGSGITNISNSCFENCANLATITLPSTVAYIGDSAFRKSGIQSIDIPGSVKTVDKHAFFECKKLKKVTFHEGTETLGYFAFGSATALEGVTIPDSVTTIARGAFSFSGIEYIQFGKGVTELDGACIECKKLKTVTFGGNERKIGGFRDCVSLEAIVLPSSCENVGDEAFSGCKSVTSITVNRGLQVIDAGAFNGTSAATLTLPESVTKIKGNFMAERYADRTLYFRGEPGTFDQWIFAGTDHLTVYFPINAGWTSNYRQNYGSENVTWKPYVPAPYKPTATMTTTGMKISWDPVVGANKYQVYRKAAGETSYKLMKTTTSTSYINTSVESNVAYTYKVRAVYDDGEDVMKSSYSPTVTKTFLCAAPTVKATNVASTGYNKLTWDKVAGAVSYKVYRSTSKTGTYTLMKTVTDGTSYVNTNAVNGTTYYYKVYAVDKNGVKGKASEAKVSTCDLAQPVVTLTAGTGKITVKWATVPGATGYKIYRATSSTGTYSLVKTVTSGSTTSFTNTGLTAGKKYYYKMVAILDGKDAATSAYSAVKYTTVK